jgi:hypothetical protein
MCYKHILYGNVENGCSLFDYSTKRYLIREKHTRVQTTKFYECHSDSRGEIDVLSGFNVENKNESREKMAAFIFHFIQEIDHVTSKNNTVTYVAVQSS